MEYASPSRAAASLASLHCARSPLQAIFFAEGSISANRFFAIVGINRVGKISRLRLPTKRRALYGTTFAVFLIQSVLSIFALFSFDVTIISIVTSGTLFHNKV